ncbi:hypothetical protein BYT27DRAFT_7195046 [Phlegmacium glaucopus]|nr:hypothetical protein BYT27DRAFT_7195046 [Phlegmacium glaucopus]
MSSPDAFVDHEDVFLQYLRSQEAEVTGDSLCICLREIHRVHPKGTYVEIKIPSDPYLLTSVGS